MDGLTIVLVDKDDPPIFASKGAERCTARNVEMKGAGIWFKVLRVDINF